MIEILNGYSLVATHACRMRQIDREDCRKSQQQRTRETMEYLLRTCYTLARQRAQHLGAPGVVIF